MKILREIPFAKLHGLGNDWIVVELADLQRSMPGKQWPRFAQAICERHTGVGADGLIVVVDHIGKKHPARVRFFNADGSEAEMSGNGIRCAGAYLLHAARRRSKGRPAYGAGSALPVFEIATAAGRKVLETVNERPGEWIFRVAMGGPILDAARVPFTGTDSHGPVIRFPLPVDGQALPATVSSMGNPHCSLFLDDLGVQRFADLDWRSLGDKIEHHAAFPNRTNVEFIRMLSEREIEVRFWERGVGPTQSSGTGSCAAVVASILNGRARRKVRVRTLAGTLDVAWPQDGEVVLTGPAAFIAEGKHRICIQSRGRAAAKNRP